MSLWLSLGRNLQQLTSAGPENAVINVESHRQDEDIGHNKIYKEGLEIKRNDSPRNGPSKGTGTIGNVAGQHWK